MFAKEQQPATGSRIINLTGNYKVLIIPVTFPDKPNVWPTISTNEYYPVLGSFPSGEKLHDRISSSGPLPFDEWFVPAIENFFTFESGGKYNLDVIVAKKGNKCYTTIDNFSDFVAANGNSETAVVFRQRQNIINQVAKNIITDYPSAFFDIDMVQFWFPGISTEQFYIRPVSGWAREFISLKNPDNENEVYWDSKPGGFNRVMDIVTHEILHMIGKMAGEPAGFRGLPDRGYDRSMNNHSNMPTNYDAMYHNGNLASEEALYGQIPLISHDKIKMGWIEPDEILVVNESTDLNNAKLADVNIPLTAQQKNDNYYRAAKIMIHEDYDSSLDEYFLVEFHNGSGHSRQFSNIDEPGINKGVLIWHIKERFTNLDVFKDNLIDLELAVPYSGWKRKPIVDDDYPKDYERNPGFNGNFAGDFDWMDDCIRKNGVYKNLPHGGRHRWEMTVVNDLNNTYSWDPTGERRFARSASKRSDFFTSEVVNGFVNNHFSPHTRPGSDDWAGVSTGITIKNIQVNADEATFDICRNCEFETRITNVPVKTPEQSNFNGAAVIQMILSSLGTNPLPAQSQIQTSSGASPSSAINLTQAQTALENLSTESYDWLLSSTTNSTEALHFLTKWLTFDMRFAVGKPPVPNFISGMVPFNGSYNDWVVVNGVKVSNSPWNFDYSSYSDSYSLYGFWVTHPNDFDAGISRGVEKPDEDLFQDEYAAALPIGNMGGGESYYSYTQFLNYYKPMPNGKYESLIEPPNDGSPLPDLSDQYITDYKNKVDVIKFLVEYLKNNFGENKRLLNILKKIGAGQKRHFKFNIYESVLDTDTQSSYNILTLNKSQKTYLGVIVDEKTGKILEVNVPDKPVKYELYKTNDVVQSLSKANVLKNTIPNLPFKLVYSKRHSKNMFYPSLRIEDNKASITITSEGNVIKQNKMETKKELVQPDGMSLEQNYPNPFNPTTNIKFGITEPGLVTLKVYDSIGQEIVTLVNEHKQEGSYSVKFDASHLPSGIYYYTLKSKTQRIAQRMLLVK